MLCYVDIPYVSHTDISLLDYIIKYNVRALYHLLDREDEATMSLIYSYDDVETYKYVDKCKYKYNDKKLILGGYNHCPNIKKYICDKYTSTMFDLIGL